MRLTHSYNFLIAILSCKSTEIKRLTEIFREPLKILTNKMTIYRKCDFIKTAQIFNVNISILYIAVGAMDNAVCRHVILPIIFF